jgi:predicted nucleotidyltransferase
MSRPTTTNPPCASDLLQADPRLARLVGLLKGYDPDRIILFGSRARGQADEYSDYDVLVVKRTDRPFVDRLTDVVHFLLPFEKAVDVLVYTPEEFDRMSDIGFGWLIRQEGVVVYERAGSGSPTLVE